MLQVATIRQPTADNQSHDHRELADTLGLSWFAFESRGGQRDAFAGEARAVGRCDAELERRIAERLVLHALAFGANNHDSDREKCLE